MKNTKGKRDYKDRTDELINNANEQINKLVFSKEDTLEFLNFKNKFYQYSFRNQALIQRQFSGAMAVGTFNFWKEQGYSVQRGEKGIEMLFPVDVKVFKTETGEHKSVKYATKEEKEKIASGEITPFRKKHYKVGHVFDISQTNAPASDLPKLFPNKWLDGDVENYETIFKSLVGIGKRIGSELVDSESKNYNLGTAKGGMFVGTKEIVLNHRNSELQNIKTYLHELAHATLHSGRDNENYTKAEKEFQAELVAYAVCNHFNLDVAEYSLNYMKNWTSQDTDIATRSKLLEEVYNTSKTFISAIESDLALEKVLSQKIDLNECGKILKDYALLSYYSDEPVVYLEVDEFEDCIADGTYTNEDWLQFKTELSHYKLIENNIVGVFTDYETLNADKDTIEYVAIFFGEFENCFNWDNYFEQTNELSDNSIKEISKEAFSSLIEHDNYEESHTKGSYLAKSDLGWVAMANENNFGNVEDFPTKELCLAWLNGEFEMSDWVQSDKFPDENFRKAILQDVFNQDMASDNTTITRDQLEIIKQQTVLSISNSNISEIQGIEYFENLKQLDTSHNSIQTLDLSELKNLVKLSAYRSEIKDVIMPNGEYSNLRYMDLSDNKLTTLDVSYERCLKHLIVEDNYIKEINLTECEDLELLDVSHNRLETLDVSDCYNLSHLHCNDNLDLTELDLENNEELELLKCHNCNLDSLDVSHCERLDELDCSNNGLNHLNIGTLDISKLDDSCNDLEQENKLLARAEYQQMQDYDNGIAF